MSADPTATTPPKAPRTSGGDTDGHPGGHQGGGARLSVDEALKRYGDYEWRPGRS
jgi:hypothetical protein